MRRLIVAVAAALLIVAGLAGPAAAHARLTGSDPAGGATVAEAPTQVTLTFSERIETSFGGVQVFDPAGARVQAGEPQILDTRVILPLGALRGPGTYTVVFRIISGDSHPIESSFAFNYAPPAPEAAGPPATVESPVSAVVEPPEAVEPSTPEAAGPPATVEPSAPEVAPPVAVESSAPSEAVFPPPRIEPLDVELERAGAGTAVGLWAARLVNYLALAAVAGLLLTAGVLLASGPKLSDRARRAARIAVAGAAVWALSGVVLFVFGLSNAAARSLPAALDGDLPARFAATRLGSSVLAQAGV
ncbi:MAG: copper resistance protein CopC, partial [Egibacteraceae bacterium]